MTTNLTGSRRPWAQLTLVLLAWVATAASANGQTCGSITNGGFESDLTGWTNNGSTVITTDIHSGGKAARTGAGQGGLNRSGLIPVTAGQPITFQVWAKISAAPTWAGVGLDFLNASGVELSEINLQITATSYALRSATQTVPAGATSARIWTWKSGTTGNLFVDDFCLTVPNAPDTQPPSTPAGLSSSALTQTGFTLGWSASSDNVAVTAYEVFRNGTSLGIVSTTSLSVTGLSAATTSAMTVRARDAAGNWSAQSAALNVTTPDTQAPTTPTGLSSTAITQTGFTLSWTASTDNVGVTGYQVFRNGASVATPSGTSVALTGLGASTTYAMTVRARDAAGNLSASSTVLNVTTAAAPVITCGSVTNNGFENGLTGWTNDGNTALSTDAHSGSTAAITGTGQGGIHYASTIPALGGQNVNFRVWAKVSGPPSWAGVGIDYLNASGVEISEAVLNVTSTSYTEHSVTAVAPAGTARVNIWTFKSGTTGNLFLDDFCLTVSGQAGGDTQAPSVPSALAASNVTASSLTISWTPSTDNVGVTGYEVFRNGTSISTPSGTSASVTGLAASTTYSLTVRARDAAGNWSALSPALSVTTTGGSSGSFNITVNKAVTFQTIDGFGFFGAMNTWWSTPSSLWSDAWGDQVISDLGITIWRNEYYPPADQFSGQDADWNKQRPVVRGLKAKADQYGVNLKFIFTVWSPPSSMKVKVENNTRLIGTPHPFGTKQGGALDPTKYGAYANYLIDGIRLYQNEGINLYALSPQNEPFFVQAFNSCWYKQEWYPEMLINVVPSVRAMFPNVKIFGSEGMLQMEAADENWPWFYHKQILDSQQARNNIDILAVHGYQDGVAPTSGSILGHLWSNHKTHFGDPMGKRQWMTETSGYQDSWTATPGAFSLALDMMSGLNNGNMSGWVFWQGSENPGSTSGIGEFVLMNGAVKGKKYYVSKQFYRYIRPGAVRISATSTNSNVFVSAYQHTAQGTHTIVLINTATTAQSLTVGGAGLPASFTIFRTSATDNAADVGTYITGSVLSIPARSVVTLQAGGTPLATVE